MPTCPAIAAGGAIAGIDRVHRRRVRRLSHISTRTILALAPVNGLGPFHYADVPIVGTDNFDFMIESVPNIVAIQADAIYASNHHAESDTFDEVDQQQVRLNSAIVTAVPWGFANDGRRLPRHTRTAG
jgi:hypothetical protein